MDEPNRQNFRPLFPTKQGIFGDQTLFPLRSHRVRSPVPPAAFAVDRRGFLVNREPMSESECNHDLVMEWSRRFSQGRDCPVRVHLIGVAGSGMSGLGALLLLGEHADGPHGADGVELDLIRHR